MDVWRHAGGSEDIIENEEMEEWKTMCSVYIFFTIIIISIRRIVSWGQILLVVTKLDLTGKSLVHSNALKWDHLTKIFWHLIFLFLEITFSIHKRIIWRTLWWWTDGLSSLIYFTVMVSLSTSGGIAVSFLSDIIPHGKSAIIVHVQQTVLFIYFYARPNLIFLTYRTRYKKSIINDNLFKHKKY